MDFPVHQVEELSDVPESLQPHGDVSHKADEKVDAESLRRSLKKAGSVLRRICLHGSLAESSRVHSLQKLNRRLKEEVSELEQNVGNARIVKRFHELQQDRKEQDQVIAALRKALCMNGVSDAQVEKVLAGSVFDADRAFGASREQLMQQLKQLRAAQTSQHITTRTARNNNLVVCRSRNKDAENVDHIQELRQLAEEMEALAERADWAVTTPPNVQNETSPSEVLEPFLGQQMLEEMQNQMKSFQEHMTEQLRRVQSKSELQQSQQSERVAELVASAAAKAAEQVGLQLQQRQESLQRHVERAVSMRAEQGEARAHQIATATSLETKAAMEVAREAQLAAESARQLADSWQAQSISEIQTIASQAAAEAERLRLELATAHSKLESVANQLQMDQAHKKELEMQHRDRIADIKLALAEELEMLHVHSEAAARRGAAARDAEVKAQEEMSKWQAQQQADCAREAADATASALRAELAAARAEVDTLRQELRAKGALEAGTAAMKKEMEKLQLKLLAQRVDTRLVATEEALLQRQRADNLAAELATQQTHQQAANMLAESLKQQVQQCQEHLAQEQLEHARTKASKADLFKLLRHATAKSKRVDAECRALQLELYSQQASFQAAEAEALDIAAQTRRDALAKLEETRAFYEAVMEMRERDRAQGGFCRGRTGDAQSAEKVRQDQLQRKVQFLQQQIGELETQLRQRTASLHALQRDIAQLRAFSLAPEETQGIHARADISRSEETPDAIVDLKPRRNMGTEIESGAQPCVQAIPSTIDNKRTNQVVSGNRTTRISSAVDDNRVVPTLESALEFVKEDDVVYATPPRSGATGDSNDHGAQPWYRKMAQDQVHSLENEIADSLVSSDFDQLIADANTVKGMLADCLNIDGNP